MIDIDINTISDAGIDNNLSRIQPAPEYFIPRYDSARNVAGGTINTFLDFGSPLYKTDGTNQRTIVNDGTTDRVLIGRRLDGTYGIDVSKVGYSVYTAYEGDMDLSSKSNDDWLELNPANFTYSSATVLTISSPYVGTSLFQIGDKIKLTQNSLTKYFYVIATASGSVTLYAGADYSLTNHTIVSIYISRLSNPAGHPILFNYSITDTNTTSLLANRLIFDSGTSVFWMSGNIVYWTGYVNVTVDNTSVSYIFVKLPINQLDSSFPNVATLSPGIPTDQPIKAELGLVGEEDELSFSRNDGSDFPETGTFLQWSIFYLIQ
jgi:hypothetical protein